MFAPTGLLGPTSAISPVQLAEDTQKLSFAPTGLLGQCREEILSDAENLTDGKEESIPPFSFVTNGLLEQLEMPNNMEIPTGRKDDLVSSFCLVTNGLLSASTTVTSEPIHTLPASSSLSTLDDREPSTAGAIDIPSSQPSNGVPQPGLRATTFSGETIYLKQKSNVSVSERILPSNQSFRNLLDVPIHRLMDQLSSITAVNLQRAEQPTGERVNTQQCFVDDTLWVDKYRPKRFTDLVGNEKVARDALAWVKQWDYCVFGKTKGKKRSLEDETTNQDKYRRPHERVLLLSGPPGLGKTTLAHVLARQAGYDVMEINASDARSGSIVDDRIRPTLETGSSIGCTKPVLLVIDEIDGATGAGDNSSTFIHKLVQLIQARPTKKRPKKDQQGPRPILRPIICICNDLNASTLTKLRPFAYSIRFFRPADTHIVTRLKEICQAERLKAESRALATLVSAAKGDLRGCLNTLQFIKRRGGDVTEPVIRRATSGMKEGDVNYLAVLNNLFSPLSKKQVKELGLTDEEEGKYVSRLSREIEGSGKESNVASGCFGHYATLRRHDANLARHEQGAEWLTVFDIFTSAMYNDGDFALNHYLPYTLVPFFPLFHQRGGDRVERNQDDWEHFQLTRSNEEILNSFSRCLRNATIRYGGDFRHLLSHPVLQLEFAPYINRIISPPLRPVNSQIIRPTEKSLMTRLVDIMTSLELRFVQERADDGQLSYRLDPPIDVFVTYDGKRAPDITVSRYAVRHLVSGEIEAKLIARDTEFVEKGKKGKHSSTGKSSLTDDNKEDNLKSMTGSDHPSKRRKVDTRDIADRPPTDFFGRPVVVPLGSSFDCKPEKQFKVSYKFLEGNSAAVRRPVKVNMFL